MKVTKKTALMGLAVAFSVLMVTAVGTILFWESLVGMAGTVLTHRFTPYGVAMVLGATVIVYFQNTISKAPWRLVRHLRLMTDDGGT